MLAGIIPHDVLDTITNASLCLLSLVLFGVCMWGAIQIITTLVDMFEEL